MIVLLDTSHDLDKCAQELDLPVGQLLTPLTGFRNRSPHLFGIDNGAFSKFDAKRFRQRLNREKDNREGCLFVAAPDVVGSARRTLEVFDAWQAELHAGAWPIALVLQDGIEDLPIPWHEIAAVFVGGTNGFKNSDAAMQCAKAARILGKHVHVGRINGPERFDRWREHADSCDGSGIALYTHMRRELNRGAPLFEQHTTDETGSTTDDR